MLKTKSILT